MAVGNAAGDILYCRTTSGRPFTISMFTAATIDLYQKVSANSVATTNSPDNYRARENFYITDVVATTATGKIELESDGRRTQVMIDFASQQPANAGRPALNIPVGAGTELRVRAATTLA